MQEEHLDLHLALALVQQQVQEEQEEQEELGTGVLFDLLGPLGSCPRHFAGSPLG